MSAGNDEGLVMSMRIRCFSAVEPGWSYYRDLLPHLAHHGHDVEIIISGSSYREQLGGTFATAMRAKGVKTQVIDVGRERAGRGWDRVKLYTVYLFGALRRSLFGRPADVNFFLTQPPFFFVWGLVLKALRRQRYVVVLMDMYPDVVTASGMARPSKLYIRIGGWLARYAYRRADAMIVIGRCMRERLIRDGVSPDRIHLATNWSNAEVRPIAREKSSLRRALGIGDRFVVMYSGNMGVAHYFDDILEVARRFRDDDGVRFVFAGDGSRRKEIERACEGDGLPNVVLLPFQPVEKLAESLSLGDVHFVSLRKGFEGLMVPSKVYSVLDAGRGIIYQGDRNGEIAMLIEEEAIGRVLPIGEPDALESVLRWAVAAREEIDAWGIRSRGSAVGRYSRRSAVERYATVFASIAQELSQGGTMSAGGHGQRVHEIAGSAWPSRARVE